VGFLVVAMGQSKSVAWVKTHRRHHGASSTESRLLIDKGETSERFSYLRFAFGRNSIFVRRTNS
jgi:hypothetical protein